MKLLSWLAFSVLVLGLQPCRASVHAVTAVRHWSLSDVTRIIVEVSGDFEFRSDRLHNPERIYFDLLDARPRVEGRRSYTEHLTDRLVSRIRVALHAPDVTRVVLDLNGDLDVSASRLSNPSRLIIELRNRPEKPSTPAETVAALPATPPAPAVAAAAKLPAKTEPVKPQPTLRAAARQPDPLPAAAGTAKVDSARPAVSKPELPRPDDARGVPPALAGEIGKSARHTSSGQTSLVRALGLKIGRVVIDPGHGGHDQGTEGPHGLLEKDLVLDVAQRWAS